MTRRDRIFCHQLWMTPVASYVGLCAAIYGSYLLISGKASLLWLLPMVICTFGVLMGITVGMHRLFCHASFRANSFWHVILAFFGTIAIYGSTVQWPAMHMSHHRYTDTDLDPHYTGWRYLFWKKNKRTIFNQRVISRLYRNSLHRFLHKHYVLVVVSVVLALMAISPNALVFCYLIPLGWLHFVGSAHQVFAHGADGPRNLGWLEVLLFTGGEWLHGEHHKKPRQVKFGTGDVGSYVIWLIRSDRGAPQN